MISCLKRGQLTLLFAQRTMQPKQNWCCQGLMTLGSFVVPWHTGQVTSASVAMALSQCSGLGRAVDGDLLPLTGTTATGAAHCKKERGQGQWLCWGGQ